MTKNKFINNPGSTGSAILKFIVLVGLILGVCAFVLQLTTKCKCKAKFTATENLGGPYQRTVVPKSTEPFEPGDNEQRTITGKGGTEATACSNALKRCTEQVRDYDNPTGCCGFGSCEQVGEASQSGDEYVCTATCNKYPECGGCEGDDGNNRTKDGGGVSFNLRAPGEPVPVMAFCTTKDECKQYCCSGKGNFDDWGVFTCT